MSKQVPLDSNSRNFCYKKKFSIIKRYEIFSQVARNIASDDSKKDMVERFGRVIHSKLTDLKPEEENYLNQYNQISFERTSNKFNTQLHHMKNKIGVFRDPVFPKSYPWIIPKFTLDCEKAVDYTKPNVFTITQEFHRGKPLDDKAHSDEMNFWQFRHYEKFHVSDPTVTWGPKDIGMSNLLFDDTHNKICFVDNEGFVYFRFTKDDHFRYKVMSVINPNIGEYLTGKDCNTPYETMKDDWSRHDGVKVFFKRLFFYQKVIFNFQFIDLLDEEVVKKNIKSFGFDEVTTNFNKKLLPFQNWFHHEGERVMQMTDEYVKPKKFIRTLDRKKYPNLFINLDTRFKR